MKKTTIFLLFLTCITYAQQSVFYTKPINKQIENFGLEIYNINYIKNNEYFNFIADGYTLLATQIQPEFIYQPNKEIKFKAGFFAHKNFGENNIKHVIPTFSFSYNKGNHQFTLGTLNTRNNHRLIEPLYASEKILTEKVLETGLNYLYSISYLKLNAWVDWENYIEKNDTEREVLTAGLSSEVNIITQKNNRLFLPLQFVIQHRGGQINNKTTNTLGVYNFKNLGIGLGYEKEFSKEKKLRITYNYLTNDVSSLKEEIPFKKGNAHYIQSTFKIKNFDFSVSYFTANKFNSIKGNDMFQSQSRRTDIHNDNRFVNHTEPKRNLIFAKIAYKHNLTKTILFGLQLEGFYQLNSSTLNGKTTKNQFDNSLGCYIILNDIFNL